MSVQLGEAILKLVAQSDTALKSIDLVINRLGVLHQTINQLNQTGISSNVLGQFSGVAANIKSLSNAIKNDLAGIGGVGGTSFVTRVTGAFDEFHRSFSRFSSSIAELNRATFYTLAAASGVFVKLTADASKFEATMSAVKGVLINDFQAIETGGGNATKAFQDLTSHVLELSKNSVFGPSEIAGGLKQLAQAGLGVKEAGDVLIPVLEFAKAGSLGVARAVELAADTMFAFNLKTSSMTRVLDVMTKAANLSTTDLEQMGLSFTYVSAIAGVTGQRIEEVAGALSALAQRGIKGSIAGTGLAQMLSRLAKGGDDVERILRKYNIALAEVDPTAVNLTDILDRLGRANITLGDNMLIFGERAGKAALALQLSGSTVKTFIAELDASTGATKALADVMTQNVSSAVSQAVNSFKTLREALFLTFSDTLRGVLQQIQDYVNSVTKWVQSNKELAASYVQTAAQVAVFFAAFVAGTFGLSLTVRLFDSLLKILVVFAGYFTPIGAAMLALIGYVTLTNTSFEDFKQGLEKVKEFLSNVWDFIKVNLLPSLLALAESLLNLAKTVVPVVVQALTPFLVILTRLVAVVADVITYISNLVTWFVQATGPIGEFIIIVGGITVALVLLGNQVFKLIGLIGAFGKAILAVNIAQALWNASMGTGAIAAFVAAINPITVILTAIAAAIGLVVYLWNKWGAESSTSKQQAELEKVREKVRALQDELKGLKNDSVITDINFASVSFTAAKSLGDMRQLITLLERRNELQRVELKQLSMLIEKYPELSRNLNTSLEKQRSAIETYEKQLSKIKKLRELSKDQVLTPTQRKEVDSQDDIQRKLNIAREQVDGILKVKADAEKAISTPDLLKNTQRDIDAMDKRLTQLDELAKVQKEGEKQAKTIEELLTDSRRRAISGHERELELVQQHIDKVNDLADAVQKRADLEANLAVDQVAGEKKQIQQDIQDADTEINRRKQERATGLEGVQKEVDVYERSVITITSHIKELIDLTLQEDEALKKLPYKEAAIARAEFTKKAMERNEFIKSLQVRREEIRAEIEIGKKKIEALKEEDAVVTGLEQKKRDLQEALIRADGKAQETQSRIQEELAKNEQNLAEARAKYGEARKRILREETEQLEKLRHEQRLFLAELRAQTLEATGQTEAADRMRAEIELEKNLNTIREKFNPDDPKLLNDPLEQARVRGQRDEALALTKLTAQERFRKKLSDDFEKEQRKAGQHREGAASIEDDIAKTLVKQAHSYQQLAQIQMFLFYLEDQRALRVLFAMRQINTLEERLAALRKKQGDQPDVGLQRQIKDVETLLEWWRLVAGERRKVAGFAPDFGQLPPLRGFGGGDVGGAVMAPKVNEEGLRIENVRHIIRDDNARAGVPEKLPNISLPELPSTKPIPGGGWWLPGAAANIFPAGGLLGFRPEPNFMFASLLTSGGQFQVGEPKSFDATIKRMTRDVNVNVVVKNESDIDKAGKRVADAIGIACELNEAI